MATTMELNNMHPMNRSANLSCSFVCMHIRAGGRYFQPVGLYNNAAAVIYTRVDPIIIVNVGYPLS